jgi:cell wall assembly regulator SMI1
VILLFIQKLKAKFYCTAQSIWWNEKWIPLAEDGMGNTFFLDLDPTEKGKAGQIIFRDHEGPIVHLVSKSFRTWIKEFVDGNLD